VTAAKVKGAMCARVRSNRNCPTNSPDAKRNYRDYESDSSDSVTTSDALAVETHMVDALISEETERLAHLQEVLDKAFQDSTAARSGRNQAAMSRAVADKLLDDVQRRTRQSGNLLEVYQKKRQALRRAVERRKWEVEEFESLDGD
jgi:phage-related minor tail protein